MLCICNVIHIDLWPSPLGPLEHRPRPWALDESFRFWMTCQQQMVFRCSWQVGSLNAYRLFGTRLFFKDLPGSILNVNDWHVVFPWHVHEIPTFSAISSLYGPQPYLNASADPVPSSAWPQAAPEEAEGPWDAMGYTVDKTHHSGMDQNGSNHLFMTFTAPKGKDLFLFTAASTHSHHLQGDDCCWTRHFWSCQKVLCRKWAIGIYNHSGTAFGKIFTSRWTNPLTSWCLAHLLEQQVRVPQHAQMRPTPNQDPEQAHELDFLNMCVLWYDTLR